MDHFTSHKVTLMTPHPTRSGVWQLKLADSRWVTLVGVSEMRGLEPPSFQIEAIELDKHDWE